MKRKLAGLLCVCMLFSGCGNGSSLPLQTESPSTEPLPTQTRLPLLEQGIALEESRNLLYIPNAIVESMTAPEMRLLGNGLLLSECNGNELVMKHISLEDGALVKECAVPARSGIKLFIGSGEIGVCDRESGLISVLDDDFHPLRTYAVPPEGDDWYLNSELDTLYIFHSDLGLQTRNLETGETGWLVDHGFQVSPTGGGTGYILFRYTDRADQKTYTRYLNLSTATLETLPIDGAISSGFRQGETWLLQKDGKHLLVQDEVVHWFPCENAPARLLSPRRHLLAADSSSRNLNLYETDGTFLSGCSLPQNSNAVVGTDFVWSGYWEGYFFIDFIDGSCRLMFWDVGLGSAGEELQMELLGTAQPFQAVLEHQLYERAAQLSSRFGVDIRIAEQCAVDYSHYETYLLTDPIFVRSALDVLEETLSLYPEGFFRQLPHGAIESIRIELVGGLTAKNDVNTHPTSVGAFAQDMGSYYAVILDGFLLQSQTLFHEFSHIIDARLKWDAMIRPDALYSEEAWLALQPEGFRYARTYTGISEEILPFLESGYFVTEYSLTYPTEDRAVLMESAMANSQYFEPGPGAKKKLQYYADCIRDCFDTKDWPETTLWEQVLE